MKRLTRALALTEVLRNKLKDVKIKKESGLSWSISGLKKEHKDFEGCYDCLTSLHLAVHRRRPAAFELMYRKYK